MVVELAISEYSESLDTILQWSTGRVSVIWRRRIERFKMLEAAYKAPSSTDPGTGDRDTRNALPRTHGRSVDRVVERKAKSMDELANVMNIRLEPYPGNTPWNQGAVNGN